MEALEFKAHTAILALKIEAISPLGEQMLPLLTTGAYIGKLFAGR